MKTKIEESKFYMVVDDNENEYVCTSFNEVCGIFADSEDKDSVQMLEIDVNNLEKWNIKEVSWKDIALVLASSGSK